MKYIAACILALNNIDKISGLVQKGIEQFEEVIKQIEELERKAKIGEATEKAFESGAAIEGYNVECYTLEQLLEWSESEGE